MNRIFLEGILQKMKKLLVGGETIGDLKISALYALGNQLEAIFYFIGHELGGTFNENLSLESIEKDLVDISNKYHLGKLEVIEKDEGQITFTLVDAQSSLHLDPVKDIKNIPTGICSFEAGLFSGIIETSTGKHCFGQQLESRIEGAEKDKFMIVIPN